MKAKTGALIGIFASHALCGLAGAWALGGSAVAAVCVAIAAFLAGFFPFAWVLHDRRERGLPRSGAFNLAMVLCAALTVPVYLWRSRPRGARLAPLLGMAGVAAGAQVALAMAMLFGFVVVALTMRFPGV